MGKNFLLFIFTFCFIPFTLFSKEIYTVSVISGKIKLDGKLDEDVWKKVKAIDNFYILGAGNPTTYKTEVKIGISEDSLYIGVICYEEKMDKIKAKYSDGGILWEEDSIEIFIYPEGAETYYQFVINAIGSKWNSSSSIQLSDWQAKVYKGNDYWSIEVRIPFEVLGRYPEGVWTGNICRNRCVSDKQEFCSWAKILIGGFHQPDIFNELIFEKNNEIASKQLRKKVGNKIKELEKYIVKGNKKTISINQKITVSDTYQILNILYKFEDKITKESEQLSEQLKRKINAIEYNKLKRAFF
ncbi:MAG TPA: sugar-binding protein [bacterium]|nr:sugar-binding protein [bacterium]